MPIIYTREYIFQIPGSTRKGTTMYKKILVGLLVFGLLTTILAACAIRDEAGTSGPEAHMGSATFVQTSVTINKGDSLTLVDDVAVYQIIKKISSNTTTPPPPPQNRGPPRNK